MPKFVPRQRKHKVLARQKQDSHARAASDVNTNQDIVLPALQSDKEARKQQIREELRSQHSKISSKKQKRLDKYIENKLRKDETADYLRRLEQERAKFDVRENEGLRSSKNLNETRKGKKRDFAAYITEQIDAELDKGHAATEEPLKKSSKFAGVDSDNDVDSEDSFEANHKDIFDTGSAEPIDDDHVWLNNKAPLPQGTGLAQPLDIGSDGLPIIPTRSKRKRLLKDKESVEEHTSPVSSSDSINGHDDLPWEGFDSETDSVANTNRKGNVQLEESSEESSERNESDHESDDENSEIASEGMSDTGTDESEELVQTKIHTRTSAFKTWATQQLNKAIGHTPAYSADGSGEIQPVVEKKVPATITTQTTKTSQSLINGLPEVADSKTRVLHSIQIERAESIQESRSELPILQREQEIMEAIHNNAVVVIKGDTGSGKTTQLPQFLYEAGYGDPKGPTPGLIGITQPRRVAAVSMAKRVGEEMGAHGNKVSHQIRFDSTVSASTAIKFMTDGILLRELSQDLLLKKYSAIIIDEAHERSVNTDILVGILSKVVPARLRKDQFNPDPNPLKLIIMSATLNIDDFLHDKLFSASLRPPIVEAEGRQYRVTTHFARKSRGDYVEEVVEKVRRAHHKLPRGGILVFLTGQNEIRQAQSELSKALATSSGKLQHNEHHPRMHLAASDLPLEIDDLDLDNNNKSRTDDDEEETDIEIYTQSDEEAEAREFEISDDEEDEPEDRVSTMESSQSKHSHKNDPYDSVHILPLYSQLPTREQLKVFDPPPERSRLIVLATNVAETSLTIPGIRYVFDCGRSKERHYDLETGVQSFEIDYISKASAQQRAGRAGRTGPGHCWRLYSSAIYERYFPDHTEPEILQTPAESVVLQIKGLAYPRPVAEFPFPTTPTLQNLRKAELLLQNLGAIDSSGTVTEIGKRLSVFPLSPRLGKILVGASHEKTLLAQIIALVSGLAVSELYVNEAMTLAQNDNNSEKSDQDAKKQAYGRAQATLTTHDRLSDVMKLLTAVTMYMEAADKEAFCEQYSLRPKAMAEVIQLLKQLKSIVQANYVDMKLPTLTETHKKWTSAHVRKINHTAAAGYIDQIAVRWDCAPIPPNLTSKPRRTLDVPYLPLMPLSKSSSAEIHEKAVFIHPSSVLARLSVKDCPQYIVYTHLQQAQSRVIGGDQVARTRMFPLTPIDVASLGQLAKGSILLQYGKPIPQTKIEELPGIPKRRNCWISTELRGGGAGSHGWSLPPTKVRQVLDVKSSSGWRVEEVLT